jgi:hypothetical protein
LRRASASAASVTNLDVLQPSHFCMVGGIAQPHIQQVQLLGAGAAAARAAAASNASRGAQPLLEGFIVPAQQLLVDTAGTSSLQLNGAPLSPR